MLAMTFRPSPAASMTSPSIFSVAVERMPFAPRTASRSSPRSGGRSWSTLTSKPSSRRRPASGISRVTRTFKVRPLILLEELAQHRLQDAAVPQVLDLHRRVHARPDPELSHLATFTSGLYSKPGAGCEIGEALYVVGLRTVQPKTIGVLAPCELQGEDAHPDQVRAVDALEALGDDGPYAEQERALRRPVARGAGAVLLAREDDQGDAFLLVLHRSLVDGRLLPIREVNGVAALLRDELVAQADVGEGAAHHDLVVAAAATVGVEVARVHAFRDQVLPRRHLGRDGTCGGDVVR